MIRSFPLRDVFGGHQQLLDRRRRAALQQDRLVGPADLRQQEEVLHVARADLDDVETSRTSSTWRGSISSVTIGRPVSSRAPPGAPRARRGRAPGRCAARCARQAAAEHRRAGRRHRPSRLQRLLPVFDGAGTRDQAEPGVADPARRPRSRSGATSRATKLVRLQDRQDALDPRKSLGGRPAASRSPIAPITVASRPRGTRASAPASCKRADVLGLIGRRAARHHDQGAPVRRSMWTSRQV